MMQKVKVVIIVATLFAVVANAVTICNSEKTQTTFSYAGTWVGNASLDGVVIGDVRFNCFEDKIIDFTISINEFPYNIIDEVTGKKIGSGTVKSFNRRYSPIGKWITTITNNQFFFNSSVHHLVKNDFLGVFTSNDNATGTWQYVRRETGSEQWKIGSEIFVSPPIAWDATKVHTPPETPTLTPTPSPTPTPPVTPVPLTPTPTSTPSPTATVTVIPTPEKKGILGFEVIFAIAGLLAVAYLLGRRK